MSGEFIRGSKGSREGVRKIDRQDGCSTARRMLNVHVTQSFPLSGELGNCVASLATQEYQVKS